MVQMKGPCGFCQAGHHDRCCVGIKHQGKHLKYTNGVVWVCGCEEDSCPFGRRKCAHCGNKNTDEVDPATWECFDVETCHALVEERRDSDPMLRQLREIKEIKMAKIENEKAEKAATRTAAAKTGTCVCGCEGETKGGKFLPGHDARFVSTLVGTVADAKFTAKAEQSARKALTGAGASEKLVGKFDKSLGLAKDKAEKRAAAEQAKKDAKAEKAEAASK
jgi:hypothetical protein